MKITKIHINEYQQFKDFELDLTYPEGHEFAGQPLKKVCFIGQSGTGKTTLLGILKDFIVICKENRRTKYETSGEFQISFEIGHSTTNYPYVVAVRNKKIEHSDRKNVGFSISSQKTAYIYFPSDIKHDLDFKTNISQKKSNNSYIDLDAENIFGIWNDISNKIKDYQKKEADFRLQLTYEKNEDIWKKIDDWKSINKNPLEKISENFLSAILDNFNLKIEPEVKKTDNVDFIQIVPKNSKKIIPFERLSTGTKQIILSFIPLYHIDTRKSIILVDEPERSLFPDVQRNLIKYYTDLAPDAQFFFATHSPLIASQFEPCERVILQFDDDGYVRAKRGIAPEGDDPNDLLLKDFGIRTVLSDKGEAMWKEFIETRRQIEKETDEDKKTELINKYLQIGSDYNFAIYEKNFKK